MALPSPSDAYFKRIHTLFSKIIWDCARDKITQDILMGDKRHGGLGLSNIQKRNWALKAQWVFQCLKREKIANLAYATLGTHCLGHLTWYAQIRDDDVVKMFPSSFWREVWVAWAKIHFDTPRTVEEVLSQIIWLNSNIRLNGKPLINAQFVKAGVFRLCDIIKSDGQFLSPYEFYQKFRIGDYVTYQGIVKSIPYYWKAIIHENYTEHVEPQDEDQLIEKYSGGKKLVSLFYKHFNNDVSIVHKACSKWENLLEITLSPNDFVQHTKAIYTITNYVKLRSFQYRLLYHAILTNARLFYFKVKDTRMCENCNLSVETVIHLLVECPKVRPLWNYVCQITDNASISKSEILFNNVSDSRTSADNVITLVTKYYIFQAKCLGERISVTQLRKQIMSTHNVEEIIAKNNNKLPLHIAKWHDCIDKI